MSQSSQAPEFGPYNVLMCRPGKIASFSLNAPISQSGLVIAMDFYPYSAPDGSIAQTIFSIRNTATNFVSLSCEYHRVVRILNIWLDDTSGPMYLFDSADFMLIPLQMGKYTIGNFSS